LRLAILKQATFTQYVGQLHASMMSPQSAVILTSFHIFAKDVTIVSCTSIAAHLTGAL